MFTSLSVMSIGFARNILRHSHELKKLLHDLDEKLEKRIIELENLARARIAKIIFKFKRFSTKFDDHLLRGEIKISIIHNNDPKNLLETYSYATGKGGKNASEILPPWQAKVNDVTGVHMYKYIDDNNLRVKNIEEVKALHSGEKVEIVKLEFYVKELNKWRKKKSNSTLWPKEWELEKIKRITKEASENVYFNVDRKYRGISKEGFHVEFFSETDGVIDNAYLFTKNLK